jgi:hypothetical protein
MIQRTRRATLAGLLVALTVAAGYSLAGVPNVELVTLLVFLSGFLLGTRVGPVMGAASWGLYSALNPLGAAVPPVLVAQMSAGALIGLAGAAAGPFILERVGRPAGMILCGLTGLVLTVVFQALVNTAAFFTFVDDRGAGAFWTFMAGGIAFTAMHLVWNTSLFFVTLRPVMSVLDRHRLELRY